MSKKIVVTIKTINDEMFCHDSLPLPNELDDEIIKITFDCEGFELPLHWAAYNSLSDYKDDYEMLSQVLAVLQDIVNTKHVAYKDLLELMCNSCFDIQDFAYSYYNNKDDNDV